VHTIDQGTTRERRRRHSAEFKAEAVNACRQSGVSIASAAMARSVNANLLRRWIAEAERDEGGRSTHREPVGASPAFIALAAPPKASLGPPIQIEVRRGPTTVIVQWPVAALQECSLWLRELLK
jgi:transposase